jgi:hypothetical protein
MMNKLLGLFSAGFLAVLLAGCFNPIEAIPPKQDDHSIDPFTLDVLIGKDAEDGRSIAGPDAARIKGTGIRNIIQLIVADKDGKIVAFDEVRRERDDEEAALLRIDSIAFGQTYHFLLLMGHWERDYTQTESEEYQYTDDPPTLLAAGLKEQHITGSGKVTVTMWPIVVDTVFTAGDLTRAPAAAGRPGKVTLHPADWDVTWTIKGGLTGNGLTDLVRAQKIRTADAGETLLLMESSTMVRNGDENGQWEDPADLSGNVITRSIGTYTSGFGNIGKEGSINFNLEYVPFNLTDGTKWTPYNDDSVFDLNGNPPVWIIRNGVNDKAQNEETDFNAENPEIETANWNGAAAFVIAPDNPAPGELVIKDGVFAGPSTSSVPKITFTTEGYTGNAEAYYAVVPDGSPVPAYTAYTGTLPSFAPGNHQAVVDLSKAEIDSEVYDVYVVLFKDGKVSAPIKINTGAGGEDVDWIWGDVPYKKFYVASGGLAANPGTKAEPLATVQQALAKLAALYAADASWPDKGTEDEVSGGIIILDEVPVEEQITISGTGYPPIILCNDPETPGGKLKAQNFIREENSLLRLESNARVTLEGGLILAGTGDKDDNIRGVIVTGASTFTMNGGEISGYTLGLPTGGGVYVANSGTFIMNGGEISGNSADWGGGVYVAASSGTFTMNDGEISDNSAASGGGGVFVARSGTFTMNGGLICNNHAPYGGGVYGEGPASGESPFSMFTIKSGEISRNIASVQGGGVYTNGTFTMSGGKISGNSAAAYGGGVFLSVKSTFAKSGGTIYGYNGAGTINSNSVKNSAEILENKGHAVYRDSTYRKETTVEPNDSLTYNYPNPGDNTGW